MVILNKIYTRTGDDGKTGIGDGSRVSKLDLRVIAGGSVDETNSQLGMASAWSDHDETRRLVECIQQRLFDLGADITCPWEPGVADDRCPRIAARHVVWLEEQIDSINSGLTALNSFILPGGTRVAACIHVARSVCRRAEIDVLRLQEVSTINPQISVFLNRLSDLLFVLGRSCNNGGRNDVLWKPDTGNGKA